MEKSEHSACCPADEGHTHTKERVDWLLYASAVGVAALYFLSILSFFMEGELALPVWLHTMSHTAHEMLHTMWWGVVMGIFMVGLLSKVPRGFVMRLLGKGHTWNGLLRAVGAGVLLDLCSHGILLVGAKLYERGASTGQIMAFLLASPWNSFSLTLILFALIGWKLTLLFIGLSAIIALLTGWIFDALVHKGILPENPHTVEEEPETTPLWPEMVSGIKNTKFNRGFWKDVLTGGVKDARMVLRWLLFGILLAAVLRASVGTETFEAYFGPTLFGLMVTIFFATVLEVCSEGATPIAADIINRAAAPGNGFAFLMSGVATDYTEIMVLKDTTKSWKIALFLPLITVPQVLLIAWIVNVWGT